MITAEELKAWLDQSRKFVLIDTGLADDFAVAHLPGAEHACVFEVSFLDQIHSVQGLEMNGPQSENMIVLYGPSPRSLASTTAAEKLSAAGFSNVFDFRGGLAAWQERGWTVDGTGEVREPFPLQDRAYSIDPAQSTLEWIGRSLAGRHHGTLAFEAGGSIILDGGRAVAGSFGIDMTSIEDADLTDGAMKQLLHSHLRSEDFFDVARHPRASFQLESAEAIPSATPGEPNYVVHGQLLLKGIAHPLSFPAMIDRSPAADGSLVARANFDFDRTRWNVLYGSGKFYEKLGGHLVSDLITLDLKIVAR